LFALLAALLVLGCAEPKPDMRIHYKRCVPLHCYDRNGRGGDCP